MILFAITMILITTLKKCHFNTPNLKWVLPVAVHFNLMVDFEVLVLMVPTTKNTISKYL
jgi:hypothetical protein